MPRRIQQLLQFIVGCFTILFSNESCMRNDDSQKLISFAIITGSRFEETTQMLGFFRRTVRAQSFDNSFRRHGCNTFVMGRSPSMNPITLSQTVRAIRIRTSNVWVPICGVITTLSNSKSSGDG